MDQKNPRSMACRIGAGISGNTIGYTEKPINHTSRVAIQCLPAVMGGAQSIDSAAIDEAFGVPSEEARIYGLDTQHIIAHESSVPLVADPLGGSYFVESLTNEIETRTLKLLNEIDSRGGMWECLKSGWLLQQFNTTAMQLQTEIDQGRCLIVGVISYRGPDGPISETDQ